MDAVPWHGADDRSETSESSSLPFPKPVAGYSPNQLKELKLGQLAELAKIRARLREGSSRETDYKPRQPTAEEQKAIHFHDSVVKMIDDALVPKPPQP